MVLYTQMTRESLPPSEALNLFNQIHFMNDQLFSITEQVYGIEAIEQEQEMFDRLAQDWNNLSDAKKEEVSAHIDSGNKDTEETGHYDDNFFDNPASPSYFRAILDAKASNFFGELDGLRLVPLPIPGQLYLRAMEVGEGRNGPILITKSRMIKINGDSVEVEASTQINQIGGRIVEIPDSAPREAEDKLVEDLIVRLKYVNLLLALFSQEVTAHGLPANFFDKHKEE